MPTGRQLENDRAQLFAQVFYALEKLCQPRLGILQFFHVREIAAAFGGETETSWRNIAPRFDGARSRQTVKRVIDFYRIKVPSVKGEHI
jgi:hypothetical protein